MRQKITWMHYLLTGISSISLAILISCNDEGSNIGPLDIRITYINETDSKIGYFQYNNGQIVNVFDIDPLGSYTMNLETEFDSSNDIDPLNCCSGNFEGFQGNSDILIEFDNTQCLIFESGEGPTTENIGGYSSTATGSNSIEFSYTITTNDRQKAENCE